MTTASVIARRGPWLAAGLTSLAYWAGSNAELELNRSAALGGEWWRIVTGHFVHYGVAHSRGDIWAFFVWATVVEAVSRRLLAVAAFAACWLIGLGVLIACPQVTHYGGLSGVDVGLFAVILCIAWSKMPRARLLVVIGSLGLLAKTGYELVMQRAILAPDLGDGVLVLPAAHALGAIAGVLAWIGHHLLERGVVGEPRQDRLHRDDRLPRARSSVRLRT